MGVKKSVRVSVRKPTADEVMLHRFLNFGKISGLEPEFNTFYKRKNGNITFNK
jgi:hypothetical protein